MTPIRIPDHIARIEPYVPGKPIEEVERDLGLTGSVKLASNENPLGPSPAAIEAVRHAAANAHRYPDGSGHYLRKRLSEIHGIAPGQIILGNGSTELVEILARTFLGAEGNAVMADQSFIMYRIAVMAVNGNARVVPLKEMTHDLQGMAGAVDQSTRVVFIANPNNPTGTYVSHEALQRFVTEVPEEVLIVLDEAYREYVEAAAYPDSLSFLKKGRRIAILRTFSKIYGLAGLRMGYALTTTEVCAAAEKVRSPFNTGSLSQAACLAALDDQAHVERSRKHNARELAFLQAELAGLGVTFFPSVANFVLVDTRYDAEDVFSDLLQLGVIVRPMKSYDFPTCIRVTVGTRQENLALISALSRVLERLSAAHPSKN